MSIVINKETVKTVLPEVVQTKGEGYNYNDHYDTCKYVIGDQPACLVGVFLARLGVSTDALHDLDVEIWENITESSVDSDGWWMFCKVNDIQITKAAKEALHTAQQNQDRGETWGRALQRALEEVERDEDVPIDAEAEVKRALAYLRDEDDE